jgi:hypothetical protein
LIDADDAYAVLAIRISRKALGLAIPAKLLALADHVID